MFFSWRLLGEVDIWGAVELIGCWGTGFYAYLERDFMPNKPKLFLSVLNWLLLPGFGYKPGMSSSYCCEFIGKPPLELEKEFFPTSGF